MTLLLDSPPPSARAFRPHPGLAGSVRTYFSTFGDGKRQRLLPDGCVDLLFDLSASARVTAVGPATMPFLDGAPSGAPLLGVVLEPGTALAFLGVPLDAIRDRRVDLREIVGRGAGEVLDLLRGQRSDAARIRHLNAFLLARAARARPPQALVKAAIGLLRMRRGQISVRDLCRELGSSERRLQRAFVQEVGMSAKTLARILRVHAVLEHRARMPDRSLTALAFEFGFSDQAHLSHEVRLLTGLSPSAFFRERRLSDSYKERIVGRANLASCPEDPLRSP